MEEITNFLLKWQTLLGAALGGVFALLVALLVSYKAQRREEVSAGYLIIGNLTSFTSAIRVLKDKAENAKISNEDYPFWLCQQLLVIKPTLSGLYEASVSRIIFKNDKLSVHLDLIRTYSTDIEAPFSRINDDVEYNYIHEKNKRNEEHIKADAAIVARGYTNIAEHAQCAIYLIPRLVTSHLPSWYLFKSYFCPNKIDDKSNELLSAKKPNS